MTDRISGTLEAEVLQGGQVRYSFVPRGITGDPKPLLAKDVATFGHDLRSTFGLTSGVAAAATTRIQSEGNIGIQCDVDGSALAALFEIRQ